MNKNASRLRLPVVFAALLALAAILTPSLTQAYIGPGAGFAILGSFLAVFITFLAAIFLLVTIPFRLLLLLFKRRGALGKSGVKRVVIVGLDGLDPVMAQRLMDEGKMPNHKRLMEQGTFSRLHTVLPAMSPVAWSTFSTGTDPSGHSIFDFLTRNPKTYMGELTSSKVGSPKRFVKIGKYSFPLGKPELRFLQKSQPFWKILGEKGIFSTILRVPITFPPQKFNGLLLSAMCTPDLKGTQGTFSYFTTDPGAAESAVQGVRVHVKKENGEIHAFLTGPENSMVQGAGETKVPLTIRFNGGDKEVEIQVDKKKFKLEPRTYSDWTPVEFKMAPGVKARGICRFYIMSMEPEFALYVTAIHLDPSKPALPISHPRMYASALSKLIGSFATLGLAEDTWALNERVIDEEAFLGQAYLIHEEREKMFFHALKRTKRGVVACVFDGTDRIQHCFMRYLDDDHPANRGKDTTRFKGAIEDLYIRMDGFVGRVMDQIKDDKTALMVISDHGFAQFKRGVNPNAWFRDNGYLVMKDNRVEGGDWFEGVDWSKTRAFALGLVGVFLNIKGREGQGIVEPADVPALKQEIKEGLEGYRDENGEVAIEKMFITSETYKGPYTDYAPDLLMGYNAGYRHSWECAVGKVTKDMIVDNTKSWSGDHCINPERVPGVLFCNRSMPDHGGWEPGLVDIAPSVLDLFGVEPPAYMNGRSIFRTGKKS